MLPQIKVKYPNKIAVKTEAGVYYLNGGVRYLLPTQRVVNSWSFPSLPATTEYALSDYKKAGSLGFRDGSLIRSMSGSLYIISDGMKRREITDPDWLMILQLDERDFVKVSNEELKLNGEGEPLG